MMARWVLPLLAAALLTPPAAAWNAAGHMIHGALAYAFLKERSPDTLARVVALLRQHPEFASRWSDKLEADFVGEDERDLYLFMLAARWADDVRRNRTYDRPSWHYTNFPFKPPGQPESVQPKPPDPENILRALQLNRDLLRGQGGDGDKAVALCWLFHLIGDLHQPLHTVSLFTTDFPNGDRGGNLFFIRAREQNQAIRLHTLWDDLLSGTSRFQTVRNRAIELRSRVEFAVEQLAELRADGFDAWAAESARLARQVAYRNGELPYGTDMNDAPVLPDGYTAEAKAIAERRIVVAGHRLARTLESVLLSPDARPIVVVPDPYPSASEVESGGNTSPVAATVPAETPRASLAPRVVLWGVGAILVIGGLLLWYALRIENAA
jgi:hypothetical protein